MSSFKAWQIAVFILLGIVALGAGLVLGEYRQQQRVAGGADQLSSFTLSDTDGKPRSSSEWQGKPMLINFWATWCRPCREELPLFVDAQAEHGDNLQVLAIALDNPEAVKRFMTEIPFNFPSLLAEAEGMEIMAEYGNNGGLPFTLAVDSDSNIAGKRLGKVSKNQIDTFLEQILN